MGIEKKFFGGREYRLGDTVFAERTERIDGFGRQQDTASEFKVFRTVVFGGEILDIKDAEEEFLLELSNNNGFEKDGERLIFSFWDIVDEAPMAERGLYSYRNGLGQKLEMNNGVFTKKNQKDLG